ncbi:MAG: hypothetical protein IKT33_00035 [Clostridia bacterium]|nr:hypothetical protein [Clostridia bacterium]
MEQTQFILHHIGTVTINHEYTVDLQKGQALVIDWFPDNDLIITTSTHEVHYNAQNTPQIAPNTYLIQIPNNSDLNALPIKFERYPYIVAGNIVINQAEQTYLTADQIDILPNEIVATHGNNLTRILYSGDKTAIEHYRAKSEKSH